MDEDLENYLEHLRDIAQGARRSGNAHLMVDAMTLVDRVKGDELQRAREYWEVELTAKHQRVIPPPPGSARPDGDGKLVGEG